MSMLKSDWERLIVAALAVGGHPVEKVLAIEDDLRAVGLLDPENLCVWSPARIDLQMRNAGYRRGLLNGMYAVRLVALGQYAMQADDKAKRILASGSAEEVEELLSPVYGVGPKVIATFLASRGSVGGKRE